MMRSIGAAALAALIAACGSGSPREDLFGPEIPPGDIVVETRHSGISTVVRAVVRSETEWRPFVESLTRAGPDEAVRNVDFRTEMVLVASLGLQREAGRAITFRGIQRVTGEIVAEVLQLQPDPRCDSIEIETTPLVAVAVRRSDVPVRFIEQSEILDACP